LVWNRSRGELPSAGSVTSPLSFHQALPDYVATPLVDLPTLADEIGVESVRVKDESLRLGLPAFKILGASWAVYRALRRRVGAEDEPVGGFETIAHRLASCRHLRLVASTEGNHGRAVARVARWLGLRSTILIPASAASTKIEAIRSEGAEVVEVDGSDDDTVERVRRMDGPDNLLIQDTAWEGYEAIPRWVVEGYATMLFEVDEQLAEHRRAEAGPFDDGRTELWSDLCAGLADLACWSRRVVDH
jgi:diaminopropionate ammonia-lyase